MLPNKKKQIRSIVGMLVLLIFLILVNVYQQRLDVYWTSFLIIGGSLLLIGVIYQIIKIIKE
ncbi:hypothetical protein EFP29_05685 [Lactobacillus johnsonii]|nr:hypothetical protein [Lactobacillus johnsonii]MCT3340659.1 hypothetical protein [Lactobacillus johnsonii]MCT3389338.1 hypothetical protein [Lactobacillus johnsonii]